MTTPWKITLIRDLFFRRSVWDHLNECRGIFIPSASDWVGHIESATTAMEAHDKAVAKYGPPPKGLSYAMQRGQEGLATIRNGWTIQKFTDGTTYVAGPPTLVGKIPPPPTKDDPEVMEMLDLLRGTIT